MRDLTANKTKGTSLVYPLLLAFGILLCITKLNAQTASREYTVKAVFLFNFTQFVNWPPSSFSHQRAPFIIGIYGGDPFGTELDETVAGEQVNGHPVVVQRLNNINEARRCHILFINQREARNVVDILAQLGNESVLTVSDFPGFARSGGMVNFMNVSNKIKLQINPAAAKSADLAISSKLLRLADIVE